MVSELFNWKTLLHYSNLFLSLRFFLLSLFILSLVSYTEEHNQSYIFLYLHPNEALSFSLFFLFLNPTTTTPRVSLCPLSQVARTRFCLLMGPLCNCKRKMIFTVLEKNAIIWWYSGWYILFPQIFAIIFSGWTVPRPFEMIWNQGSFKEISYVSLNYKIK